MGSLRQKPVSGSFPSKTTLLGLLKHATFVERVWFEEAITCQSRAETGIEDGPDESFDLSETDTIASVRGDLPGSVCQVAAGCCALGRR